MKIRVIGSGSKGNATIIQTASCNILIDAGLTYKNICSRLDGKLVDIDIVIITHVHNDHISGLKSVLKSNPVVYTTSCELDKKVSYNNINNQNEVLIGDTFIKFFDLSHDTPCSGVIIKDSDKELVYITDTGYINNKLLDDIVDKDIYIMESNYDVDLLRNSSKPFYLQQRIMGDEGHLSNEQALGYLKKIVGNKTKYVILAHLSEENNDEKLVYDLMSEGLKGNELKKLLVARQHEALEEVEV